MSLLCYIKLGVQFIWFLPRRVLIAVIWFYQKTLSPDHSFWAKAANSQGYCKYYPTCSEYSHQVIKKKGLIIGLPKTIWRILRCNPWNKGGWDKA